MKEELEQAFKGGIADLEKENAEFKEQLYAFDEEREKLHNENTKLKLKLEVLEEQTPWKDIKDKSEVIEQLTKAKEIIKELLDFDFLPDIEIKKKAEQFLNSEVSHE